MLGVVVAGCFAPSAPLGAPCGDEDACPTGLVCAPATNTCERSIGSTPDASADSATDTTSDSAQALRSTFVDQATSDGAGGSVTLKLPTAVPVGSLLVLEVAARGVTPTIVVDSRGHSWIKAAEIDNSTETSVAAIFHVVTVEPLSTSDEIIATVGGSDGQARGIALFLLEGATSLDQVGSAQASTPTPSVSTTGPLTASPELAFGVVVTGFNTPTTFVPGLGFVEVGELSTALSSGSFNHKTIVDQIGTFEVTATTNANFALALATYR